MERNEILTEKISLLANSFKKILNESNPRVVESLESMGHNPDQVRQIELFDWFQGVGLYGYFKLWSETKDENILFIIEDYYRERISDGLPEKNINSMAPMLTLLNLAVVTKNQKYLEITKEWAKWLYTQMPRTDCGAFCHLTCEASNTDELWDDTLFMSVLFLARAGIVFNKDEYITDAVEQFFLHAKYLEDTSSHLWYHGWTFDGEHNFVKALWARGNSWITMFVPDLISILNGNLSDKNRIEIIEIYNRQINTLLKYQHREGLWHTLIDDPESYLEASGSAGIAYGMLRGISEGILENKLLDDTIVSSIKTIEALIPLIDSDGTVHQVSGGTPMGKDSLDFYRDIPLEPKPYGQAMALLALLETFKKKNGEN